jgi:hypothetical protein
MLAAAAIAIALYVRHRGRRSQDKSEPEAQQPAVLSYNGTWGTAAGSKHTNSSQVREHSIVCYKQRSWP